MVKDIIIFNADTHTRARIKMLFLPREVYITRQIQRSNLKWTCIALHVSQIMTVLLIHTSACAYMHCFSRIDSERRGRRG